MNRSSIKNRIVGSLALVFAFACGWSVSLSQTAATKPKTLESKVFNYNELVVKASDFGDQRQVFRSRTDTLDELEVHMTTLKPGQEPHPAHQHAYEEMVILKEGSLEATVNGRVMPMPAGSVLFVAPNDMHGIRNTGKVDASYLIVTLHSSRPVGAK